MQGCNWQDLRRSEWWVHSIYTGLCMYKLHFLQSYDYDRTSYKKATATYIRLNFPHGFPFLFEERGMSYEPERCEVFIHSNPKSTYRYFLLKRWTVFYLFELNSGGLSSVHPGPSPPAVCTSKTLKHGDLSSTRRLVTFSRFGPRHCLILKAWYCSYSTSSLTYMYR
jgi:hypothetical protein